MLQSSRAILDLRNENVGLANPFRYTAATGGALGRFRSPFRARSGVRLFLLETVIPELSSGIVFRGAATARRAE